MTKQPLLSICIPTYNRAGHLEKLLEFLTANILIDSSYEVELIVVNNNSKDDTRKVLDRFEARGVRAVHRETFLLTAEENIIHSLEYCKGEYVWFLGDDDVPVLQNFPDHYRRLQARSHDYFLFNPSLMDTRGTVAVLQNIWMNREDIDMNMADLIGMVGCLFTFAGISNQIIRRSLLSKERGVHYMQRSLIYSMAAWIIDCCISARTVFVNRPLVYYRENDYGNDHWEKVAKKLKVGNFYFWSLGLIDLLGELIAQGRLTPFQVGHIFEVTRDGSRYRLIDDMLFKTYQQIKHGLQTADTTQKISEAQMNRAVAFFYAADATCYDIVRALAGLNAEANGTRSTAPSQRFRQYEGDFLLLFNARQSLGQWFCRVIQIYHGYEIIRTPVQYTAILAGDQGFRDSIMRVLDPMPQEPRVLIAETWPQLAEKIHQLALANSKQREAPVFNTVVHNNNSHTSVPAPMHQPSAPIEYPLLIEALRNTNQALSEANALYRSDIWQASYPLRAVKSSFDRMFKGGSKPRKPLKNGKHEDAVVVEGSFADTPPTSATIDEATGPEKPQA